MNARSVRRASGPVDIVVRPPGSKSITNRALITAALAPGTSTLVGPLQSDDTDAMAAALIDLGVRIDQAQGAWHVTGERLGQAPGTLDARMSGTTLRFLTAALTLADGRNVIDGTDRLRQRPIGGLVAALTVLGADIRAEGPWGGAPISVVGPLLEGGPVEMDGRASSQPISAVMLVAPHAKREVVVSVSGNRLVSAPYLQTTREVMAAFGVAVDAGPPFVIPPDRTYTPTTFQIEADASAAVYPWSAAAVTGGRATVTGIAPDSTQADLGVLEVLEAMGCVVGASSNGITVEGPERLSGITADMTGCPDGAMAVAVAAAFADGPTQLTGLRTLALKETDRLFALDTELEKLGASVERSADELRITPGRFQAASIATYDDHRMAMAFSVAGLVVDGISIEDPECVAKTWPGYWEEFETWS